MATIKRPNELDEAAKRLNAARNSVDNMTYGNFKSGDLYQGLQRDYQQQGQRAMKDTLGQVAARTGGMASSYATTAANQSYNNYMQALEDAARSMYNEEYSRAQNQYNIAQQDYNNAYSQYRDSVADQRYADELAYQKSRDSIADQRYADEQKENKRQSYLDSIIKSAATGIAPVWDQTMEEKFGITEADFDNAVNIGLSQYKNSAGYLSNQAATDERLKQIFGAEGFDWDAYDWNGEAEGTGSAADYFKNAGSAYGADYWEQYSKDAQQGYADADTKEAQDEVMEILEAGGTPDTALLEKTGWLTGDVTDSNSDGIPDEIPSGLTGAARTLWQNNIDAENEATALENEAKAEEDKTKNYTYQNTPTGRNDIISTLTNSASLSLSDKDQKNFDYIYGDGAYDAVQLFVRNISPGSGTKSEGFGDPDMMSQGVFEEQFNYLFDELARKVPSLTEEQIFALIQKANPRVFTAATTEGYFSGRRAESKG